MTRSKRTLAALVLALTTIPAAQTGADYAPAVRGDWIYIRRIGVQEPIIRVYEGSGQYELDQGYVVQLDGYLNCTPPREVGCNARYAGHRTSAGAPFYGVDTLVWGDKVQVWHGGNATMYYYNVHYKELLPVGYVPTNGFADPTLQTSYNSQYVWIVHLYEPTLVLT